MKHNNPKRKLKSQDNIKMRLNNKVKKKYSVSKLKSSNRCLTNDAKSDKKLNKAKTKEMKKISNVLKKLTIDAEKEFGDCEVFNDSKKYNQIPSLYVNGENVILKKNTVKNSATKDLIKRIIETNNEPFLKN